ncbi:MAG: cofactor-independent phosphoglycerate mutase [Nitrospira sp.]|nr:cofactor-independent phosphoglycerate mutase [Nitrospira sp.]
MKYIILVGDGMGDNPVEQLGNRTPLQDARIPNMDSLAGKGVLGLVKLTPDGFSPGSDVTQLSLLGYDPAKCYTGRSPLEAASMGVHLDNDDVAFRCNTVSLTRNGKYINDRLSDDVVMADFSAGHITTDESKELLLFLDKQLGNDNFKFYPGVSYRHLFVWKNGKTEMKCTPPHDITDKPVQGYLPAGDGVEVLMEIMEKALGILSDHPVNIRRRERGDRIANGIWLWGQGKAPQLEIFYVKHGLHGSMISAVDLTKGIGKYAGFDIIDVPGATGYTDTNYRGKAEYALKELFDKNKDIVFIHVEAPDEAGHNGDVNAKVKAIEDIDEKVVGTILEGMNGKGDYKILILCDHKTPVALKTHSREPIPFILYDSRKTEKSGRVYDEVNAADSGVFVGDGTKLIERFLRK